MIKKEYNGWFNRETWNINLRYQEVFENMIEEQDYDDLEHVADSFEALVEELELEKLPVNSFAREVMEEYLGEVNWEEIAGHYFEEVAAE